MEVIGNLIEHLQRWFARYKAELATLKPEIGGDQHSLKLNGMAR